MWGGSEAGVGGTHLALAAATLLAPRARCQVGDFVEPSRHRCTRDGAYSGRTFFRTHASAAAAAAAAADTGPARQPRADEDEPSPPPSPNSSARAAAYEAQLAETADLAEALRLPISHEVTLSGHDKMVTALAIAPSGDRVLTGSADYTVKMFDYGGMDRSHKSFRQLDPQEGNIVISLSHCPGAQRHARAARR